MSPLFGRHRREDDLDDEIRAHIEMAVRDRMAQGEPREEAERAVRREFGEPGRVKETTRRMWGGVWWDRLRQDLRFGARSLIRDRGFTVVAVVTLGLGIGVTSAVLGVADAVVFRPLPFPEPDELVALGFRDAQDSPNDLFVLQEHTREVADLPELASAAGYSGFPPVVLTGQGDPVRLDAAWVDAGFHETVGVMPTFGRSFADEEIVPGGPAVAILGHEIWQTRFGGSPDVVGRTVMLDGSPYVVVGIMPRGFTFPQGAEIWLPVGPSPFSGADWSYSVVGRLAEGVSPARAQAALSALAVRLEEEDRVAGVVPLRDVIVGDARTPMLLFLGAVGLVLVIACANVANLLLMRGRTRAAEIGVRSALGAGRTRLVRQLLTESVLLALCGGLLGMLVAVLGIRALEALAPPSVLTAPRALAAGVSVYLFTLALSTATGIAFGLFPAFRAAREGPRTSMSKGSRTHSSGRGFARQGLVVGEVCLAVTLLTGAGLLVRSFMELRSVELGFDPEHTLVMEVDLPQARYPDVESMLAFHDDALAGLRQIPGIQAVGGSNFEPFGSFSMNLGMVIDGLPVGERGYNARQQVTVATPGYLEAMGIRVLAGRGFTDDDQAAATRVGGVAVVNRAMADRYWPDRSPVGARMSVVPNAPPDPDYWLTVVGVVDDAVRSDLTETPEPIVYRPVAQMTDAFVLGHMRYVARAPGAGAEVAREMRAAIRAADPDLPVAEISSMDDLVLASIGDRVFQTRILGLFAALALLLAAVGVFGVVSYTVTERRREFGIRIALGAEARRVASSALGEALLLVLPGLGLGCALGVGLGRVFSALLYQIAPMDPVTLAGVTALLALVALAAAAVPARRASRIDPSQLLRSE